MQKQRTPIGARRKPISPTFHIAWRGLQMAVKLDQGVPIAIPLDPHGPQPAFFTDEPARARPLRADGFVGDVRLGGSCNAEVVELVPHCHGTHTECRGHLTKERLRVQETVYQAPCLAQLISLKPQNEGPDGNPEFTRDDLQTNLQTDLPIEALITRTLPNDAARRAMAYEHAPAYSVFSLDAIAWLAARPLKHLLVDSPSLDPAHDAGRLSVHRHWWCMADNPAPQGLDPARRSATEMIFVPDTIADGLYWLHLGLSPLLGDATPSRPVIYPVSIES